LALRISSAPVILAAVGLFVAACSRADATVARGTHVQHARIDAGPAAPANPAVDDGAGGAAARVTLPVADVGDCPAICDKLLRCKQGPFDALADCSDACESSIDDRTSARTYRCVAKAKDCAHVKSCTH